jgi:hypothetical protein
MFFKAFTAIEDSPLPAPLTFTVEHQASQILADGDLAALRHAVDAQTLPESLCTEVEFFGAIPRDLVDQVKHYFQSQAHTLYATARQLLDEPDNHTLRDAVRTPLQSEEELRRLIGTV